MGISDFGDDRTPYERGRDDSAEMDPESLGTFADDLATGLNFFIDPEYKEGYRDGVPLRDDHD